MNDGFMQSNKGPGVTHQTCGRLIRPGATKPRITIVTPSFNQGRFIEQTIQSVLSQDYDELEYLVMDGGSGDETLSILKRYESQLQWWSEKDEGQAHAINKGFRRATGEILGWINSDDFYEPGALIKIAEYFTANPGIDLVYGEGYLVSEDGARKRRFPATEPTFDLRRLIFVWDYMLQQSTFFRREMLERIGYLDESLHYGLDWDLWIRAGKACRIGYMPEYLGNLREYDSAKSFAGGYRRVRELYGVVRSHTGRRWPAPSVIIYAVDWLESLLYRRLNMMMGGRLGGIAGGFRRVIRTLLSRYIRHQLTAEAGASGQMPE